MGLIYFLLIALLLSSFLTAVAVLKLSYSIHRELKR